MLCFATSEPVVQDVVLEWDVVDGQGKDTCAVKIDEA